MQAIHSNQTSTSFSPSSPHLQTPHKITSLYQSVQEDEKKEIIDVQEPCLPAWEKFKEKHKGEKLLKETIKAYKKNSSQGNWQEFFIPAFLSPQHSTLKKDLREIWIHLSNDEKLSFLNQVTEESIRNRNFLIVERFVNFITKEELLSLIPQDNEYQEIFSFLSKINQESIKNPADKKTLKRSCISKILRFFNLFLDTLMMGFSFFKIGKETTSTFEAYHLLSLYFQMISFPFIIASFLLPLLGSFPMALAYSFSTCFLVGGSLLAYIKFLKPCPENISLCTNLTEKARNGELEPVFSREDIIDQVITALAASEKSRKHPLLIGPTGVGKTSILNAIAQRIAQGNVPDHLKNCEIFRCNTGEIIQPNSFSSDNSCKIKNILERLNPYKKNTILSLDEIAVAVQKNDQGHIQTIIQEALDQLPRVIGITTKEEYEKYIKENRPFARRFIPIEINGTTKEQTKHILRNVAKNIAPEIEVSEKNLDFILESSKGNFPNDPMCKLTIEIEKLRTLWENSSFNIKITILKENHRDLISKYKQIFLENGDAEKTLQNQILQLEENLQELELLRSKELENIKILKELTKYKKEIYSEFSKKTPSIEISETFYLLSKRIFLELDIRIKNHIKTCKLTTLDSILEPIFTVA